VAWSLLPREETLRRRCGAWRQVPRDKIGMYYPVNDDLARLLSSTLADSRWDLPYLGIQVLTSACGVAPYSGPTPTWECSTRPEATGPP
jgi:hypothetical protein